MYEDCVRGGTNVLATRCTTISKEEKKEKGEDEKERCLPTSYLRKRKRVKKEIKKKKKEKGSI